MILFPYARDVEYADGNLSLILQFFDNTKTTEINMNIEVDPGLAGLIEELMSRQEV